MTALRDAERLLREAHMPESAGGVTRMRWWLRWCLKPGMAEIGKPGYKRPHVIWSESRSNGRRRKVINYD